MSIETKASRKRDYEMRIRAEKLEETRRRITEAAVELHGTVGPARTTVTEVARLAGVRRATVYNHFPGDDELLDACSSHWIRENPPPDPETWAAVADPAERLGSALPELYAWYAANREMMGNSLRDESLVPALAAVMAERWWPYVDRVVEILARGRPDTGKRTRGLLRLAVSFHTWQTLADAGLGAREAATTAAALLP